MKTLKELKEAAKKKKLRWEINRIPSLGQVEIGIEYRNNIWAWWVVYTQNVYSDVDDEVCFFRETYNCICGRQNKTFSRGFDVERQLFRGI